MQRKYLIILVIIVIIIIAIAAFLSGRATGPGSQIQPTDAPSLTLTPSSSNRSENIIVDSPVAGETVGNPLLVTGQARTFEQQVSFRLSQTDGRVLVEDYTTATAPDLGIFGPYEKELTYPQPTQSTGVLEVFQSSARDGSEIDKVTIPVRFVQGQ